MSEQCTCQTPQTSSPVSLQEIEDIVKRIGTEPRACIPLLQAIQEKYRYLPQEALRHVCAITSITPAQIMGVSTFYSQFRHHPVGKHIISVCKGTACHVKGANQVSDAFMRHLEIPKGEKTDKNKLFTLEDIACLGCCTLAPVVQIDGITFGHVTPESVEQVIKDFLQRQSEKLFSNDQLSSDDSQPSQYGEIQVGLGSCCIASGSGDIVQAVWKAVNEIGQDIKIKRVGCVGMCYQVPLVKIIEPTGDFKTYARVKPEDISQIVASHFKPDSFLKRLQFNTNRILQHIYTQGTIKTSRDYQITMEDTDVKLFLLPQQHIAKEDCGKLDPLNINDYIKNDGFVALKQVLTKLNSEQIIDIIKKSGLRGRGGAGFPTWIKWDVVKKNPGSTKYIVCNGDEGDPGAFMDRMILESYPYRVIEGILIAAVATHIHNGYFYIRAEYPLAVKNIRHALNLCKSLGYIGQNILNSGFSFDISIMEGAGAFVCGEETALIQSIEGKRGMPVIKPPYPAQSGLWGFPTVVNNVETFSLIPWILRNGPEKFAAIGTAKSSGTKVFALTGKIKRGGLIEVPQGITIREIVEKIGGGIANNRKLRSVQIGGPSGGCIPEKLADVPIDFESLTEAGAMMGSGGMVVLDDSDCMVDFARFFLSFTQDQSCGKCTFCRVGTRRMLDMLENFCAGKAQKGDVEKLEDLAQHVKLGSMCQLGKTAPNPILSTIKYFREEYDAHINGKCPAKRCIKLIHYKVTDKCIGCTVCGQKCPVTAIEIRPYQKHEIKDDICTRCGICIRECPSQAIEVD